LIIGHQLSFFLSFIPLGYCPKKTNMMKKTQSTVLTSVAEEVADATSQLVCKQQSHAMQKKKGRSSCH
jgi:hypothetical protein